MNIPAGFVEPDAIAPCASCGETHDEDSMIFDHVELHFYCNKTCEADYREKRQYGTREDGARI